MEDTIDLPVTHKGIELLSISKLLILGHTRKISVEVNGTEVPYEPDEGRNYRAVFDVDKMEGIKMIDKGVLKAIAEAMETIVK